MSDEKHVSDRADDTLRSAGDLGSNIVRNAFRNTRRNLKDDQKGSTSPEQNNCGNTDSNLSSDMADNVQGRDDQSFDTGDVSDLGKASEENGNTHNPDASNDVCSCGEKNEQDNNAQSGFESGASPGTNDVIQNSNDETSGLTSQSLSGNEIANAGNMAGAGSELATTASEVGTAATAGTAVAPGLGTVAGTAIAVAKDKRLKNIICAVLVSILLVLCMFVCLVVAIFRNNHGNTMGGNQMVARALQEFEEYNAWGMSGGRKYTDRLGFSGDVPWCASFVSYIASECGMGTDIVPQSAAVRVYYQFYEAQGNFHLVSEEPDYNPQPGDFIIWEGPSGLETNHPYITSHIGIVEYYDAETGTVYTIEGNSSNRIMRNRYLKGQCSGYAHPNYPVPQGGNVSIPETYNGIPVGRGFTVTEYDRFYGRWTYGTMQRTISEIWANEGSIFTDGIATIDGKLLIACTSKYGAVGDRIIFYLEDGTALDCIKADEKSQGDSTWTEWGHIYGNGSGINVLEFEVSSSYFQRYGNPGTNGWKSEWAGKRVASATNLGSAFE